MIDKNKVVQAVSEMTQNPDWEEVLMNAPGAANLRIALAFYASKNLDSMSQPEKDEYREFREMLEAQLNAEELQYLVDSFDRMGVEAAKTHYQELLQKKGGGGDVGEKVGGESRSTADGTGSSETRQDDAPTGGETESQGQEG